MPNLCEKQTYVDADELTHRALTYDMFKCINDNFTECNKDCKSRINILENRKRFDTTISAGSGIIGGFLAIIAKSAFWSK